MLDKTCKTCGGLGIIQVDDLNSKMCLCAYARAMLVHLGPEIGGAKPLTESPLYVREPFYDATKDNIFLKGRWKTLISHLKFSLCVKGLDFMTRVTSDERLKEIYLGKESYGQRAKGKRDEVETFNNLDDFVREPDLLVLRLGFLGHKNIAMPGILKETLMLREFVQKPTWLIEDPANDWGLSYSDDLWSYIQGHFKVVEVSSSDPTPVPAFEDTPYVAPNVSEVSLGAPEKEEYLPSEPTVSLDVGVLGGGQSKKKASSWKPKKKSSEPSLDDDFKKGRE